MCFNSNITGDFLSVIIYGPEYFGASLAQKFLSAHDNGNSLFNTVSFILGYHVLLLLS